MKCSEPDCNNDFYDFDRLSPTRNVRVCRKHYRMYMLGWSENEAREEKRDVSLRGKK